MIDIITWADKLYSEGVDHKDAVAFANAFAEDGWLRFGNNPVIAGRESIREAIAQFFSMFASLSHESGGTTLSDGTLVLEARVTYTLHQGGTVTVPACTIFGMKAGSGLPQAESCRIYVDLNPLYSAVQAGT
jgi:hypothetical protein